MEHTTKHLLRLVLSEVDCVPVGVTPSNCHLVAHQHKPVLVEQDGIASLTRRCVVNRDVRLLAVDEHALGLLLRKHEADVTRHLLQRGAVVLDLLLLEGINVGFQLRTLAVGNVSVPKDSLANGDYSRTTLGSILVLLSDSVRRHERHHHVVGRRHPVLVQLSHVLVKARL